MKPEQLDGGVRPSLLFYGGVTTELRRVYSLTLNHENKFVDPPPQQQRNLSAKVADLDSAPFYRM